MRKGFIAPADFAALLEQIPDTDVRDLVAFLYNAGWRSGEGKNLEWSEVDLNSNMIRLAEEKSKSKKQRSLPIIGALLEIIQRRLVPASLPIRVSSQGQTDCVLPESIQGSCCGGA